MKVLALLISLVILTSCGKPHMPNAELIQIWSLSEETMKREIASCYTIQKSDKTWVVISTSEIKAHADGFECSGTDILKTGFYVYPGSHKVESIDEAMKLASTIDGFIFPNLNTST